MFWDIYCDLCAKKGLSPNAVAKQLSIASGSVTNWKNGSTPQNATMKKIADYFGTSVSYLSGLTDNPDPLTYIFPVEKDPPLLTKLNEIMQDMTKEELEELDRYVDYLVNRKKN